MRTVAAGLSASSATARASRACSRASSAGRITRCGRRLLALDLQGQHHDLVRQDRRKPDRRSRRPARIFSWLICESHDDKGNVVVYDYKAENSDGVDLSQAHERNRTDTTRAANRYLKRIRYGNRTPYFPILAANEPPTPQPTEWMFEVVFDYGEHDGPPTPDDAEQSWAVARSVLLLPRRLRGPHLSPLPARADVPSFSRQELGAQDCLVRSTDFTYPTSRSPTTRATRLFLSCTR